MLHDRDRMPYKHSYMNLLQCLSSSCLVIISACNIPASMSVMTNSMSVPFMKTVVVALTYTEMVMYAIVPLSLLGWKVWEKYTSFKLSRRSAE